jgi:hypothetical protein
MKKIGCLFFMLANSLFAQTPLPFLPQGSYWTQSCGDCQDFATRTETFVSAGDTTISGQVWTKIVRNWAYTRGFCPNAPTQGAGEFVRAVRQQADSVFQYENGQSRFVYRMTPAQGDTFTASPPDARQYVVDSVRNEQILGLTRRVSYARILNSFLPCDSTQVLRVRLLEGLGVELIADTCITVGVAPCSLVCRGNSIQNTCQYMTQVNEPIVENTLHVYPNPSRSGFNITFQSNLEGRLYIANAIGQIVWEQPTQATQNIYFADFESNKGVFFLFLDTPEKPYFLKTLQTY